MKETEKGEAEVIKNLRNAYRKLDPKNKGAVKREDFIKMLSIMGANFGSAGVVDLCNKFEINGFIPYREVLKYIGISKDSGQWDIVKDTSKLPKGRVTRKNLRNLQNLNLQEERYRTMDPCQKSRTPTILDEHWKKNFNDLNSKKETSIKDHISRMASKVGTKSALKSHLKDTTTALQSKKNQSIVTGQVDTLISNQDMPIFYKKALKKPTEQKLFKSVLKMIEKQHLDPQVINRLRYSTQKLDSNRSDLMPSKNFKEMLRYLNLRIVHKDLNVLYEFMKLNGPSEDPLDVLSARDRNILDENNNPEPYKKIAAKIIFNLHQLNKIVDALSKQYFLDQLEKQNNNLAAISMIEMQHQMLSVSKNANSPLEYLLTNLQRKLRISFPSVQEAFRFFDVLQTQKCSREQFAFNCAYFQTGAEFHEVNALFNILATKKNEYIDESEFQEIFKGMQETWNSQNFNIMASILRDQSVTRGSKLQDQVDISLAHNTTDKQVPPDEEVMGKLHFSRALSIRDKLRRSKHDFAKKKRTLSIADKDGNIILSGVRNNNIVSEYNSHFTKANTILATMRGKSQILDRAQVKSRSTVRESIVNPNKQEQPECFTDLINGKYMADYVEQQREQDRLNYIKQILFGKPRTFKNYVDTNSNQLRTEAMSKRISLINAIADREEELQKTQVNNFTPYSPTRDAQRNSMSRSQQTKRKKNVTLSLGLQNNLLSPERHAKANVGYHVANTQLSQKEIQKMLYKRPKSTSKY